MSEKQIKIPNISCGHCLKTIKNELGEIPGVKSVGGDAGTKTMTIVWEDPATWEQISETLQEINYPAQE